MSINYSSGVVTWSPGATGAFPVTIDAEDTLGLYAIQTFTVNVVNSQPPTFSGTPPSTLTAGLTYIDQVQASDPAGDALTYSLIGQPSGMTVSGSGQIAWPTTAANVGAYSFEIAATNPYGLSTTSPSYPLTISADTQPPTVQINISSNPADVNSTVSFDVVATDNVGVTSLSWSPSSTSTLRQ